MSDTTDYLVIGAGATGLAFADELVRHTDAHVTLVDRRDAPGGHWNDVYPYVRLHQPASFYGVNSMEMDRGTLDTDGPNAGFMSLSTGPEIVAYFHRVLADRLLPTGRVRFVPMVDAVVDATRPADGPQRVRLQPRLGGEPMHVTVRRRVVDAARHTNAVPSTHVPGFAVAPGVTVVPPNDLPRRAAAFRHHAVLGAGKTALDALGWLLSHGARPDDLTWVVPRDSWFFNRARVQPTAVHRLTTFESAAQQREAMAAATSVDDLALRMEACGAWLRLSPDVTPTMFHFATVSEGELAPLRRIGRTLRGGRVTAVEPGRLVLQQGEAPLPPQTLVIDCTASALTWHPPVPVFAGPRITLQMVRIPQPVFSAALAAYLEARPGTDEERNALMRPVPMTDRVEDYPRSQLIDMANRQAATRVPDVRDWMTASRLDGFAHLAAAVTPQDTEMLALLGRIRAASVPAAENLQRLAARPRG